MLKIGDFSKLSRISIRMLRHYDDIGLLSPVKTDKFTNYRYYSEVQFPIASKITSLKDMGFSLTVITEILKNYTDTDMLMKLLVLKHLEIKEQAEKTNKQLLLIETTINRLEKDDDLMSYNVILKSLPERYVASVRKTIPSYNHEYTLWNILMNEGSSLNLQPDDPCYTLALFHDREHKESDVDVEIQKTVKGEYKNTENIMFKTVPSVEFASATYKGSYEQISKVNEAVANWVIDNGYEFDSPMFCIYHISPNDTQSPDSYVTEVCYPVKKSNK